MRIKLALTSINFNIGLIMGRIQLSSLWSFFIPCMSQPSGMEQLPEELTLHIFSFLTVQDLATTEKVCRNWQRLSLDGQLWARLYQNRYPRADVKGGRCFKKLFSMRHRGEVELEKARRWLANLSKSSDIAKNLSQ
ncbi:F-box protein [Parachlamydia sp. AcF125]|uniref:F-box protein n=1 Tax=Parachlamydia sp. AcF125 TaxID=2795736 RepID=UPI001BC8DCC5|nr:F-box protein [Parachlamydia sp. AcF125]MBS4167823.1 hypothetical protein [Parachlamydia sp. AcF125]